MKTDDIRYLRLQAQDLGIKYVTQYRKDHLQALIRHKKSETDPMALINEVYNLPHEITVEIPRDAEEITIKLVRR
jgi:hypothetical protein